MKQGILVSMLMTLTIIGTATADEIDDQKLKLIDVFQLEYGADPQISPDGERVVYVRSFMDIMKWFEMYRSPEE